METINVNDLNGRYLINRSGEIFDNVREKNITPYLDDKGYFRIALYVNNKQKHFRIHRLLAFTFIPNPKNKPFINHKNGIKSDNRIENLEWCTPKENSKHAARTGLSKFPIGEKASNAKVTNKLAIEIYRQRFKFTRKELGKKYGLSKGCIQLLVTGKTWSHITGA